MIGSQGIIFRMRNLSKKVVEKIKTHILLSKTGAVCEIKWKNMVRPERSQLVV